MLTDGLAAHRGFADGARAGGHDGNATTTAEFKSAEGREAFLRYVQQHPELTKPLDFVSMQSVTIQNTPRAEFVYRAKAGKITVRLLAGNERGGWRIDRLAID